MVWKRNSRNRLKLLLDAGVKFYAVLGNHDIREEEGWKAQINYPHFNMGGRRFYSVTVADGLVEFFALDSTSLSEEGGEISRGKPEAVR